MLIGNKYRRSWSDAAHHARRLIKAYDICSAIRSFFVDDVTIILFLSLLKILVKILIDKNKSSLEFWKFVLQFQFAPYFLLSKK